MQDPAMIVPVSRGFAPGAGGDVALFGAPIPGFSIHPFEPAGAAEAPTTQAPALSPPAAAQTLASPALSPPSEEPVFDVAPAVRIAAAPAQPPLQESEEPEAAPVAAAHPQGEEASAEHADSASPSVTPTSGTGPPAIEAVETPLSQALELTGSDPAGGIATLVSMVAITDVVDLRDVQALGSDLPQIGPDPLGSLLDLLATDLIVVEPIVPAPEALVESVAAPVIGAVQLSEGLADALPDLADLAVSTEPPPLLASLDPPIDDLLDGLG